MKRNDFQIKPLSIRNRNRAFLYGALAVLSAIFLRSLFFAILFAILSGLSVHLMNRAIRNEEILAEKMAESKKGWGDNLSEKERRFMERYTGSSEDGMQRRNEQWMSERIARMEAEDAYYDSLEETEDDEYED